MLLTSTSVTYVSVKINTNCDYKIIADKKEFDDFYNTSDTKDIFIDLRDGKDYETGHLSKFINIPYDGKAKAEETILKFLDDNYSKENRFVLSCYSSKRASKAFMLLKKKGYKNIVVVNLTAEELITGFNDISTGPCNCLE